MDGVAEDLRQEACARVGTTLLGKWHIDALIGLGGMAAVFAATHRNGLRGAVKVPWAAYSRDEEFRCRFLREGYIANRVNHPGAVRVLDDDVTTDGRAFLVMELLDGSPLHEIADAQGGRLDAARVLLVTDRVLDVLRAAHDQGIVHRDIKPENLFLTSDGCVKVLDFGIARIDDQGRPSFRTTRSGAPMGTPGFMAPEQARGRWDLVGPQSDIWSVGATMFTLLSGALVHEGETAAEIASASFTTPARSMAAAMPDLPGPLVDLVDRALALEPAARWWDARTMQAALRDAYRDIFGEALPTVAPQIPFAPIARPSPVTPVTKSLLQTRTQLSPGRRPPRGPLMALAFALAVFAVAAVALQGSAGGHAVHRVAAAAPAEDLLAAAPVTFRDEVTHDPPVVRPRSTLVASAAPARLQPPQPDLKALFDRRH